MQDKLILGHEFSKCLPHVLASVMQLDSGDLEVREREREKVHQKTRDGKDCRVWVAPSAHF